MTAKKPEHSNNVIPYFTLENADKAIEFYEAVLGAKLEFRMDGPDGKVMHASLRIGDSEIMLTEARPQSFCNKVSSTSTYVYVDNPDETLNRARDKSAKIVMEPMDMFYGDRTACFEDPFGQTWTVAVHIEDVSADEMKRRGKEMFSKAA